MVREWRILDRSVLADVWQSRHGGLVFSSDGQSLGTANQDVLEIVRFLAGRPGIGPGARVLMCGISNAELIHGLTELGLLVSCTSDDAVFTESIQLQVPEADCCEGNVVREQFEKSAAGFDLAVLPAPRLNECSSMFSRNRLMELAGRMACLRPGGFLIQLGGSDPEGAAATHSVKCCLRQMSAFPGRKSVRAFGRQMRLRYARQSGQYAVSLHLPDDRMSAFEWDVLALNASKRLPVDCCQESCIEVLSEHRRVA